MVRTIRTDLFPDPHDASVNEHEWVWTTCRSSDPRWGRGLSHDG